MSEENVTDNWDELSDTELEKRLETEKLKREQEMNATKQNGLSVLSNGGDFKPRILQRPKEVPQKVTILKRPDSSSSLSSSNQQQQQGGSQKPQKSLEQREKEYAEARKRILGSESESTEPTIKPTNYSKISPSSSSNCLPNYNNFNPLIPPPRIPDNVIRNPRGPQPGLNGFNIRR